MKKGPHLNVLETSVIMEFFALENELNSIIKTEQYVFFSVSITTFIRSNSYSVYTFQIKAKYLDIE